MIACLSNLGNILYYKGEYDAAIAEYGRAIALKPDYANAHINLGVILAIAEYRRAITLKSDHADAHYNLGNALFDKARSGQGQYDTAIAEYRQAIALNPNDADVPRTNAEKTKLFRNAFRFCH